MANHKSAAKRARQSVKRAATRSAYKASVRTIEKKLRMQIEAKDATGAKESLKAFMSKVDKASKTNIFHTSAASRKVSRLSSAVEQLKG